MLLPRDAAIYGTVFPTGSKAGELALIHTQYACRLHHQHRLSGWTSRLEGQCSVCCLKVGHDRLEPELF